MSLASHPVLATISDILFSFRGRVSLAQYWFRYWLPIRLLWVAYFVIGGGLGLSIPPTPLNNALILAVVAVVVWVHAAGDAKRWHDRGKSAWWVLLSLVPVIGPVWGFIELNILDGTKGDNLYGPPPESGAEVQPEPA